MGRHNLRPVEADRSSLPGGVSYATGAVGSGIVLALYDWYMISKGGVSMPARPSYLLPTP